MIRAMATTLVAAVVTAGCASGDGQDPVTTTSPAVAEAAGNPWDLPLGERPPLFDPCAEIPIEAVSEGAGKPVEHSKDLTQGKSVQLNTCGWTNDEILVSALATWKSHEQYEADPESILHPQPVRVGGREAIRMTERADKSENGCHHLFFTENGTVILSVGLIDGLNRFRGEPFSQSCEVLNVMSEVLVRFVPEGDFR